MTSATSPSRRKGSMLPPLALIRSGAPRLNRSAARASPERIAYLSHKDGGWERQNPYGLTARATRDGPQYHRQTSAMKRAAITKVDFVTRKGHPFGWSAFPHQSFTQRNPAISSVMASVLGGKFVRWVPIPQMQVRGPAGAAGPRSAWPGILRRRLLLDQNVAAPEGPALRCRVGNRERVVGPGLAVVADVDSEAARRAINSAVAPKRGRVPCDHQRGDRLALHPRAAHVVDVLELAAQRSDGLLLHDKMKAPDASHDIDGSASGAPG